MKRQVGLNTSDSYTNGELMNMGKAQFTKIIAAFEQAMIGSAQEKLQQRSDLEALVEQITRDVGTESGGSFECVASSGADGKGGFGGGK